MPLRSKYQSGQKFNSWTLLSRDFTKKRPTIWLCRCECGNEVKQYLGNITSGKSSQCSLCASKQLSLNSNKAIIGKRFNHLEVLSLEKYNGKMKAKVKCDCGNEVFLKPQHIKNETYKSCGKCNLAFEKRKRKYVYRLGKIGEKFGMLTVLEKIEDHKYLCKCDCGNDFEAKLHHFQNQMPCCGCYWKEKRIGLANKLIGLKWGYLRIIKFLGMKKDQNNDSRAYYEIKCKCGNLIQKEIGHMFDVKSCGCFHKESLPKGSQNYNAKTNEIEVKAIKELFDSKLYTRREISEMMNLEYSNVCMIISKTTWKHVK